MQLSSNVLAFDSSRTSEGKGESPGSVGSVRSLAAEYGDHMRAQDVAKELGYSHIYFVKKIGSEKHRHLDWVKALLPARVRLGASYGYRTTAVQKLMASRGLL